MYRGARPDKPEDSVKTINDEDHLKEFSALRNLEEAGV
jgi:hypothetical protein